MKRILAMIGSPAVLVATLAVANTAAAQLEDPLADLSISIDTPEQGQFFEVSEAVQLSGTAAIGDIEPEGTTAIAYLVDVSGSTSDLAGIGCTGTSRIFDCEVDAVENVDEELDGNTNVTSGVAWFRNGATPFEFTGGGFLRPPGGIDDAIDALRGQSPSGGTNYNAALTAASTILGSSGADNNVVVFLTDGDSTVEPERSNLTVEGAVVKAFAIGAFMGCDEPDLQAITSGDDDSCDVVSDISMLPEVVEEVVIPGISLQYSIDGGSPITLPTTSTGPGAVSFDANVGSLDLGEHTIAVFPSGAPGSALAQSVTVEVFQDVVECVAGETCEASANDGDVSDADLSIEDLEDETVGIRAADCAPTDCVTSYDVIFNSTEGAGPVAELVVVTSRENSTPPGRAAVFITENGVERELTDKCRNRNSPIPCAKINRIRGGRTQYLVRFNSDPGFRFR